MGGQAMAITPLKTLTQHDGVNEPIFTDLMGTRHRWPHRGVAGRVDIQPLKHLRRNQCARCLGNQIGVEVFGIALHPDEHIISRGRAGVRRCHAPLIDLAVALQTRGRILSIRSCRALKRLTRGHEPLNRAGI